MQVRIGRVAQSIALVAIGFAAWNCGGTDGTQEAARNTAQALSDGTGTITVETVDGTKCLDVANADTSNGARVQVWDCNGLPQQTWSYQGGELVAWDGKCLDVTGGNTADGTTLQVWDCNGYPQQQWSYSSPRFVGIGGKCLDDAGDGGNGSTVQIWDCLGNQNQSWYPQFSSSTCQKLKCTSYNNNQCGWLSDGCGGSINCGCSDGLGCENGFCQPACSPGNPKTFCGNQCDGIAANPDNCGQPVSCTPDVCSSNQECYSGQCCTPAVCNDALYNCGPTDDGCGGSINCTGGCIDPNNPCSTESGYPLPDGWDCTVPNTDGAWGRCSNGTCTIGT